MSAQKHLDGINNTGSILVHYPSTGRQGIVMLTNKINGYRDAVVRIQGTKGYIDVEGTLPPFAYSFTVYPKPTRDWTDVTVQKPEGRKYEFPRIVRGCIYEADDTALDILAGRKQSEIMPWPETIRVMEIMDVVRRQNGSKYPNDEE